MKAEEIIIQARKKKGLSQSEAAASLGRMLNQTYSLRQYQRLESGEFPKHKREIITALSKLLDINIYDIIYDTNPSKNQTSESEPPSYTDRLRNIKLSKGKKQIPFYDADAQAGAELSYSEMTPVSAPAGTIDVGDLLNDSEAAIRIYGNSMIPNYPPGCVIGLSKCTTKFIEPGEVYVIETEHKRVIKRVFYKNDEPETNMLMCVSDNTMLFKDGAREGKLAYPPFYIPIEEVINIFCVTGVIKRNANSIIINR